MNVTAVVTHEAPWYVARCAEIAVASQGTDVDDALANLADALTLLAITAPGGLDPEPAVVRTLEIGT